MLRSKEKGLRKSILLLFAILLVIVLGLPTVSILAKEKTSKRDLLNKTIKYCETMKSSKYTATSWKAFQKELKEAKAVYKKTKEKDKAYTTAREELAKSKASLMFVQSKDKGNPLTFREMTVDQMVEEMGAGWNLGNTMDGHTGFNPSETIWQSVRTTKSFIKSVHDAGFNTIRIPVTWGTKINDKKNYAIDEAWMNRVQDIVDYCIEQDIYVIINMHHDGAEQAGWLRVAAEDIDPIYEKYEAVWRQIAEKFKDYDEHLIFESMNEVTGDTTTAPADDIKVIMNLNQIFVNVVRTTGSNNSFRWLAVPGRYTNIETTTNSTLGFDLPKDTIKNRLFVSVHHYVFTFGLLENMGTTTYTYKGVTELSKLCKKLEEKFTSKNIPVILGEYGAVNKLNTAERAYHYEAFTQICQAYGIVACAWDSGDYDFSKKPDYSFSLFNRKTGERIYPEITDGIMRGTYLPLGAADFSNIVKSPKLISITDIKPKVEALTMKIGDINKLTAEVKPDNTNDVLLWKTADSTVATVSNGNVRARGIGNTTITVFSQNGTVVKEIPVIVEAKASKKPCTSISVGSGEYELIKGKNINLKVSLKPSNTDDYVTYKSSDEEVATVNAFGKVVACNKGTAIITITSSNGLTKTVKINVILDELSTELSLAINAYYNDHTAGYYANEVGEVIKITENGQYTLTFDVSKHLSKEAKAKGITGLNNLTAIYIKDYNVMQGKLPKSALKSCSIKYDKIVVDGKTLTITNKKTKSALKASGIFDSNDPLNSWDGSVVKEVTVKDHVLNLTKIKNPQKITITFTISDLVFEGDE